MLKFSCFFVGIVSILLISCSSSKPKSSYYKTEPEVNTKAMSISSLTEEADSLYNLRFYKAAYNKYKEVLQLDKDNITAKSKIADIYSTPILGQ
jgi:hypothetical protein